MNARDVAFDVVDGARSRPFATDSALQRYFRNWELSGRCAELS
jgi:hypothetical protein